LSWYSSGSIFGVDNRNALYEELQTQYYTLELEEANQPILETLKTVEKMMGFQKE
jgi:hypothetical protein